jgi:hypothetical protein
MRHEIAFDITTLFIDNYYWTATITPLIVLEPETVKTSGAIKS